MRLLVRADLSSRPPFPPKPPFCPYPCIGSDGPPIHPSWDPVVWRVAEHPPFSADEGASPLAEPRMPFPPFGLVTGVRCCDRTRSSVLGTSWWRFHPIM